MKIILRAVLCGIISMIMFFVPFFYGCALEENWGTASKFFLSFLTFFEIGTMAFILFDAKD